MLVGIRFAIGNTEGNSRKFEPISFFENITVTEDIFINLNVFHMNKIGITPVFIEELALLEEETVPFLKLWNTVFLLQDVIYIDEKRITNK